MATSAATLSHPPVSLPLSSSCSTFFSTSVATNCFTRTRPKTRSLVVGRPGTRPEPTRKRLSCNALFGLGVPELVVIAGVAALVFGPKKLPEVGKSIGKTVKSFQQCMVLFHMIDDAGASTLSDHNSALPSTIFRHSFTSMHRDHLHTINTDEASGFGIMQAAKEFESELKKEPDSPAELSAEKPVEVSNTEEKKAEVSSSKESA